MYLKISDKQPAFLFPSNCAKKTSLRWKAITSAALKASTSGPFLALLAIEIIVPTSISAKLEQWLQAYIVYIGMYYRPETLFTTNQTRCGRKQKNIIAILIRSCRLYIYIVFFSNEYPATQPHIGMHRYDKTLKPY